LRKWIVRAIIVAVLLGGGYYIYQRYQAARIAQMALVAANLSKAQVERRDFNVNVSGKGSILPNDEKSLSAGVTGTVENVLVEEGAMVKEGDPLVILSNSELTFQRDQSQLDLELAKTSLESLRGPSGSEAEAELNLRQAQVNLENVQEKVANLNVKSPVAGEVWSLPVKVGDEVRAGEVLATVTVSGKLKAVFTVTQTELRLLQVGDKITVDPPGNIRQCQGNITEISKEGVMTEAGVRFTITATVPYPDEAIKPGMTIVVIFSDDNHKIHNFKGHMEVYERENILAKVDGTVKSVHVNEGDIVEIDDTLISLENEGLMVSLNQAEYTLSSAKVKLDTCRDEIRKQELKVRQAEVDLSDKETLVSKLIVRSPIAGKVISLSVTAGDDVVANQTIARVASVEPLTVVIPVDELDIPRVSLGLPAYVQVDALPGKTFEATVSRIAQEGTVKEGVTNYDVTVEILPSSDTNSLMLNMSAEATIVLAQLEDVLTVPVEAIRWEKGKSYVTKMIDEETKQVEVIVGVQGDLYAEIVSGLEEGDTVLLGNMSRGGLNDLFFHQPMEMNPR
jgi:HlyD family secretion protein